MINTYSSIKIQTGNYSAGFFKAQIVPREWIVDPIERDINTGIVTTEIELLVGREFLELQFTPSSYKLQEKAKIGKQGKYFEVEIEGTDNIITPEKLITLETFKNHEMVAIVQDRNKKLKIFGDKDNGLVFTFSNQESSDAGGNQIVDVSLSMLAELAAPFYEIP